MGRGKKAKGRTAGPGARKGKGSRSGNPAKRALEQKQWEARQAGQPVPGMPDLPEDFELPEELKGLLPPSGQN
jgi:hypothetical protein